MQVARSDIEKTVQYVLQDFAPRFSVAETIRKTCLAASIIGSAYLGAFANLQLLKVVFLGLSVANPLTILAALIVASALGILAIRCAYSDPKSRLENELGNLIDSNLRHHTSLTFDSREGKNLERKFGVDRRLIILGYAQSASCRFTLPDIQTSIFKACEDGGVDLVEIMDRLVMAKIREFHAQTISISRLKYLLGEDYYGANKDQIEKIPVVSVNNSYQYT
jgi:hypothetical protein